MACHSDKSIELFLEVDCAAGRHGDAVPARGDGADYTERFDAGLHAEVMQILTQCRAVEDPLCQVMELYANQL